MKFPKPRTLTQNSYPDLQTPQPVLFKELVTEIIYPTEGSPRDQYITETINQLKQQSKKKSKTIKLNQLFVNRNLYYVNMCLYTEIKGDTNVKALVDTGAANSLIHLDLPGQTRNPLKV